MTNPFDSITEIFKKLTRNQAYFLAILIAFLVFIFYISPAVTKYINDTEDRKERRINTDRSNKEEVDRVLDSINREKAILENELFMYKNNQIYDMLNTLETRFPTSNYITIYSIHNGGGIPQTGSEAMVSTLYTTDNVRGVDILRKYYEYPLYQGKSDLSFQMLTKRGEVHFVDDVTSNPRVYTGSTKEILDELGTKSICGVWIKTSPTSTYYLVVAFPEEGLGINSKEQIEIILTDARLKLLDLIDTKTLKR